MTRHVPVLLTELLTALKLSPGMRVVDCTLGDGGHAEKILEKVATSGRLMGIDADPEAVLQAKQYLYNFEGQVIFVRDNFRNLNKIVQENNFAGVDAILIDLGWSSPQFEERGRGFSFQHPEEPLDMRYSGENIGSATDILNTRTEKELATIFADYGEEKLSKKIAEAVVNTRKIKQIKTVGDLVEIILQVYRKKLGVVETHNHASVLEKVPWIGGLHPATKIFQALRIEVNNELVALQDVLPQAVKVLSPGGRLAVISFHSLEDRIVKHFFKKNKEKNILIINKKPIECAEEEYQSNPRARSAKLRVIEKI
ncbi:MAG: Ribosomal RNA small subunit methyltransferase H [Candidatus Magasanikbacteria bacterium GW2011_GWC2_37_14]|uniref:Ribosomal RNA small subunit methyltransferase H n=1 Tax=Candidatus Magasanikbacteria bacterium GW2011_GWC2_37_14 TaxID=1619046 RepID=A0A0G0GMC3_9BACT|nr:MAG: Ribosomal RNA small subunit methyltransferase H [Candidatus Magasanikbacteria bacterium GW2011_GWC2_37_14]